MTDQEIKPRWKDGVPWCDAECPQAHKPGSRIFCKVDGKWTCFCGNGRCDPAIKRMAVENEAWRNSRLAHDDGDGKVFLDGVYQPSIEAAVDALLPRYPGKDGE